MAARKNNVTTNDQKSPAAPAGESGRDRADVATPPPPTTPKDVADTKGSGRSAPRQALPHCKEYLVRWHGKVDLPDEPVDVYLSFESSRSRVTKLRYGDIVSTRIEGGRLGIHKLSKLRLDAKKGLEFMADSYGEAPALTALHVQPPHADGDGAADVAGRRAVTNQVQTQIEELLKSRAAGPFGAYPEESRFFRQFDAWTNASVARWLVGEDASTFLASTDAAAARRMFVAAMPKLGDDSPVFADIDGFAHLAAELYAFAVSRGQALPDGPRQAPKRLEIEDLVLLKPAQDAKQAIDRVAEFLEAIFRMLPGSAEPAGEPAIGLTRIERAFALFASGHLNFVPVGERDAIKSLVNCEPDSGLFFCFAEFAIQACLKLPRQRVDYWFPFVRLFVALEDAFLETYGPRLGPHRFDAYKREMRWKDLVPPEEVFAHVRRYKEAHPDRSSLDELAMLHSTNALHAAKDDIFKPRQATAANGPH